MCAGIRCRAFSPSLSPSFPMGGGGTVGMLDVGGSGRGPFTVPPLVAKRCGGLVLVCTGVARVVRLAGRYCVGVGGVVKVCRGCPPNAGAGGTGGVGGGGVGGGLGVKGGANCPPGNGDGSSVGEVRMVWFLGGMAGAARWH